MHSRNKELLTLYQLRADEIAYELDELLDSDTLDPVDSAIAADAASDAGNLSTKLLSLMAD